MKRHSLPHGSQQNELPSLPGRDARRPGTSDEHLSHAAVAGQAEPLSLQIRQLQAEDDTQEEAQSRGSNEEMEAVPGGEELGQDGQSADAAEDAESDDQNAPPADDGDSVADESHAASAVGVELPVQQPACVCSEEGCTCDFTADKNLERTLGRMGYTRCVADGGCERCRTVEASAAYCLSTGRRQRIVCARCDSASAPPLFCSPEVKAIWSANESSETWKAAHAEAAHTHDKISSSHDHGAGLFFRSCAAHDDSDDDDYEVVKTDAVANGMAQEFLAAKGATDSATTGAHLTEHAQHHRHKRRRPEPDESWDVLRFLALCAIAFGLSFASLRKQQRKLHDSVMEGLYSQIGVSSSGTASTQQAPPRQERRTANLTSRANSALEAITTRTLSPDKTISPRPVGRPSDAFSNPFSCEIFSGGSGQKAA
eukprot:TRINITY_DN26139_c0_g1_i1.p1 TRINITY_DN26139_c0_g1~~TRINITY_DN26139_c0_g1_i1.p1  ORF type:complete len:427 (+),score=47.06 TRINITY_DN26139_c0_g1_i1:119-1399(+)